MSLLDAWRRKRQPDPAATHALAEAKDALKKAKAQRPEVSHVSGVMERMETGNHFADSIAQLITHGK